MLASRTAGKGEAKFIPGCHGRFDCGESLEGPCLLSSPLFVVSSVRLLLLSPSASVRPSPLPWRCLRLPSSLVVCSRVRVVGDRSLLLLLL